MTILSILYILWGLRIIANIISFVQLWYVKEYRFDRMFIHLRTNQGKRILVLPFRRPPISIKTVFISFITIVSSIFFLYISSFPIYVSLFLLDIGSFLYISLLVALLTLPTVLLHRVKIHRAVKKLRSHAPMQVIGITGSYGKTSTKEFLATILSSSYNTIKTPASKNSPIGIAELILRALQPNHEAFVVEMGAYKKGEIAYMCSMVQPEIGIVTAINPQHQDLFGSIEHTIEAKYELIASLTGKKNVVVNADNPYTVQMGKNASRDGCIVQTYSIKTTDADWYATRIQQLSDSISFVMHYHGKQATVRAPLLGVYQISNILAACAAAVSAGMTFDQTKKAISLLVPFQKTMQPVASKIEAQCIDDTFNNNPDAAIAALEYLHTRPGKKILVFQPMIELGNFTKESHIRVGKFAADVCSDIILTNDNYFQFFLEGTQASRHKAIVNVMAAEEAALYIRAHTHAGDTVLFKGKEAAKVLKILQ